MNTFTEKFAPLIYCVTDHALLQATPDIEHTLLQLINIIKLHLVVCATDVRPRIDEHREPVQQLTGPRF